MAHGFRDVPANAATNGRERTAPNALVSSTPELIAVAVRQRSKVATPTATSGAPIPPTAVVTHSKSLATSTTAATAIARIDGMAPSARCVPGVSTHPTIVHLVLKAIVATRTAPLRARTSPIAQDMRRPSVELPIPVAPATAPTSGLALPAINVHRSTIPLRIVVRVQMVVATIPTVIRCAPISPTVPTTHPQ